MPQVDFNTFLSIIGLFAYLFAALLTIIAFLNIFLMNWIKKNENFYLSVNALSKIVKFKKIKDIENEKEILNIIK